MEQCFEGTPPNAELPSTGPDDHSGLERTSTGQGMCPVGAHSFRPGEPIYILKRDDQLVQQGKPVTSTGFYFKLLHDFCAIVHIM